MNESDAALERYFSGEQLFGDDFVGAQLDAWYRDEANGYFGLASAPHGEDYGYRALNWAHGFARLPHKRFTHALGIGSARGEELSPVASRVGKITILEPADGFRTRALRGVPLEYVTPAPSGILPFPDRTFDLVTCFGVLHHIANVSTVLREIFRCTQPGGFVLVREPITSMGDWRRPRPGLTARERGIPAPLFHRMIVGTGFRVVRRRHCMFALTSRLRHAVAQPYNSRLAVALDAAVCALPIWPSAYHARRAWQKLRPTCVFYVLTR